MDCDGCETSKKLLFCIKEVEQVTVSGGNVDISTMSHIIGRELERRKHQELL